MPPARHRSHATDTRPVLQNGASTVTWCRAPSSGCQGLVARVAIEQESYPVVIAILLAVGFLAMPPNMPPGGRRCPRRRSDRQAGLSSCTSSRARYASRHMPRGLAWPALARPGVARRGMAWCGMGPPGMRSGVISFGPENPAPILPARKIGWAPRSAPGRLQRSGLPLPPRTFGRPVADAGGGSARGMVPGKHCGPPNLRKTNRLWD